MQEKETEALLVIADISGYTSFMLDNKQTLFHAQTIITNLISTVIKEAKIPLQIAKLEGDAVFLYAQKKSSDEKWAEEIARIKKNISSFVVGFKKRALELSESNTCGCNACTLVKELKLKVVIHYGKALFYKISGMKELSGSDVILVHRLLKNSVPSQEYILFTEAAYNAFGYGQRQDFEERSETYEGGETKVFVTYPGEKIKAVIEKMKKKKLDSFFYRMLYMMSKMGSMAAVMMSGGRKKYNNIEVPGHEGHTHE